MSDAFDGYDDDPGDQDELGGRDAADLLQELVRQGRRIETVLTQRLAPAMERIAAALDRAPRIGAPETPAASGGVDDLRARLEASRSANDPDSVLNLRDELALHLAAEALAELDRELVGWLIRLIQRRLRAGTVRSDVVQLAARVADRFGATVEGASLRASLPTLRRSAGLCAVCGEPYTGLENRCPRCQAAAVLAARAAPPIEGDPDAIGDPPPPPPAP